MSALAKGSPAPNITLPILDSSETLHISAADEAVLVFFKVECPVCQYALPYFDRLFQRVLKARPNLRFFAISQNTAEDTRAFMRRYHLTMPVALDSAPKYVTSNAYGLTNVPTVFLVGDGKVQFSSVSWSKDDINELYRIIGGEGASSAPLFSAGESVAAFKAG